MLLDHLTQRKSLICQSNEIQNQIFNQNSQQSLLPHDRQCESIRGQESKRKINQNSLYQGQVSPQLRIYNRNFYLRQANRKNLELQQQVRLKQQVNTPKIQPTSYDILTHKLDKQIQYTIDQILQGQQVINYDQMVDVLIRLNKYLTKAKQIELERFFSQFWIYLLSYQVHNQTLQIHKFINVLKVLMHPRYYKPEEIKLILNNTYKKEFQNSQQLKKQFLQNYPQLKDEALDDIEIFKLWQSIRQKHHLFQKTFQKSVSKSRLTFNEPTFQPEINQKSRIYAQKSLNKYLSTNKLHHQKVLKNFSTSNYKNDQINQLNQYLSNKQQKLTPDKNQFMTQQPISKISHHELLYKRKLQKQSISRKLDFNHVIQSRKANPAQVREIVQKMYYIPQKRDDIDYTVIKQREQLKKCTFKPIINDSTHTSNYTSSSSTLVRGFQSQVQRVARGRHLKQKNQQIYDNLGKPKQRALQSQKPSFIDRDTPKLILEVNIGDGHIQKIKLKGNQDPKLVAKKFVNMHNLQSSMISVLEDLIDQNLRAL